MTVLTEPRLADSCSNVNSTVISLSVTIESQWSTVNGTIITNPDPNSFNYKSNATALSPQPLNLTSTEPGANGVWAWAVP
jgi:alpha-N-arabinofuranosidase